jgi:hypothetical protein
MVFTLIDRSASLCTKGTPLVRSPGAIGNADSPELRPQSDGTLWYALCKLATARMVPSLRVNRLRTHSLCFANEFTQFHAQGGRERVSDVNSHADLSKFYGADIRPVNVGALRKFLLG